MRQLIERLESRRLLATGTEVTSVNIGDIRYFINSDAEHGIELWTSNLDGTNAKLLEDFNPGPNNGWPQWLTAFHGKLYFTVQTEFSSPSAMGANREPWVSDGTPEGTKQIADIYSGSQSSNPHDFRIFNDHLFFIANHTVSFLYGLNEATGKVENFSYKAGYNYSATNFFEKDDLLYFEMKQDSSGQMARWQTDGTSDGTVISPGAYVLDGTLRIFGTQDADTIQISSAAGVTTITGAGPTTLEFDEDDFDGILVYALRGNDAVTVGDEVWRSVTIVGGYGDDTLRGGSGNDFLTDTGGVDLLDGGAGNDQIVDSGDDYDHPLNTIVGGAGNDSISAYWGDDLILGGDGNDSIEAQWHNDTIDGGAGDDYLKAGYSGNFILNGGDGNDTLVGGDGVSSNDSLIGGAGNDSFLAVQSNDTVVGDADDSTQPNPDPQPQATTSGPTYLIGTGPLTITGTDASEQFLIRWKSSDHKIVEILVNGIVQRTVKSFKATSIRLLSKGGNDTVDFRGVAIPATINGGAGDDTLYGSGVADAISGGDGNDWINAGAGDDVIYGDAGNDKLFGGVGNDYINGGAGTDVIRSGAGRDRIIATIGLDDLRDNSGDLITNVVS